MIRSMNDIITETRKDMAGYRVKITMRYTKPPVWRRVILPEKITFWDLHQVIQILYGWNDDHLHAFTFSDDDMEIVADYGESLEDQIENHLLVDDYISDNRYIDYTYDFGDDWKHRIVLEKIEEDYDKRYATVLKFKGDNFAEDSGGVWGGGYEEDYSEELKFNMETVQSSLCEWEFPVHERGKCDNYSSNNDLYSDEYYDEDDITEYGSGFDNELLSDLPPEMKEEIAAVMEAFQETGDVADTIERFQNTTFGRLIKDVFEKKLNDYLSGLTKVMEHKKTKMESECSKWYDFCVKHAEGSGEQQLSFNFEEEDNEVLQMGSAHIVKEQSRNSIADNLCKYGSAKLLKDYCKYLRLEYSQSFAKNRLAQIIEEAFINHPEYVVTAFRKKEWEEFSGFISDGTLPEASEDFYGINIAISIGLVEVSYQEDVGVKRARVKVASNMPEILKAVTEKSASKWLLQSEKFTFNMQKYLTMYGCIAIDELFEIYCDEHNIRMEKEDFYRNIYWLLRMRSEAITLSYKGRIEDRRQSYVGVDDVDMVNVCEYVSVHMEEWQYKRYSNNQYAEMKKGYNILYTEWDYLLNVLSRLNTDEDVDEFIDDMFYGVKNGYDVYDVLDNIYECFEVNTAIDHADIWLATMKCVLNTDIPMLKSHSRKDYYLRMKEWPIMLEPLSYDDSDEDYDRGSYGILAKLPDSVQMRLYGILGERREPVKDIKAVDDICGDYPEWIYLLARKYIDWNDLKKARQLFFKLERVCKDPNVAEVLEEFYDYLDVSTEILKGEVLYDERIVPFPKVETYVRGGKKVGRNDPCPCGSGKKFKHCCGKNT